jgi:hypothetical protein
MNPGAVILPRLRRDARERARCDPRLPAAKCTRIVDTETELNPPLEGLSLSRGFNPRSRTERDDKVDKLTTQITISSC